VKVKRTADPWRDTAVIDSRAPRFNQVVVGVVALLGVVFGWPLAWALMAAQLLLGLSIGRRACLPCLIYFGLVQPLAGEGPLEDSRPPRLANAIGTVFLAAAAAAWWLGATTLGTVLGAIVAALALLAATTGFCAGCELYRLSARRRGITRGDQHRLDPADLGPGFDSVSASGGAGELIVEFSHPLCAECLQWERWLESGPDPFVKLDVRERPDLARKYGIAVVPTVLVVDAGGAVTRRLAP
jgi:hypothetical protein